jgi:hypothetical protein
MEHVLFQRTPESRWAAVRALLLEQIGLVCEAPLPGLPGNAERYKLALASRDSRLGRLLQATALFNFDLCDEEPPPNVTVRFRPRRFPEHRWEARGGAAADGTDWLAAGWEPAHPLCRWSYLSADLAHSLYRGSAPARAETSSSWESPAAEAHSEAAQERLYCRIGGRFQTGGAAIQLDLIPATPESVLLELQRNVHRRHGADGLRLFAALMARLDRSRRAIAYSLPLAEVAMEALGEVRPGRTRASRLAKAHAVLERMSEVECLRIREANGKPTLHHGRLLTVVGRSDDWRGGAAEHPAGVPPEHDPCCEVLVDPLFYRPGGTTLGEAYRDLPEAVSGAEPRRHPYLPPLFVWLRCAWGLTGDGVLHLSARQIFHDSGLWVSPASPYRAVEQLKRELGHLKECGLLGRWRLDAAGRRDPLEDRYRLDAPDAPMQPNAVQPRAAPQSFAGREGWSEAFGG